MSPCGKLVYITKNRPIPNRQFINITLDRVKYLYFFGNLIFSVGQFNTLFWGDIAMKLLILTFSIFVLGANSVWAQAAPSSTPRNGFSQFPILQCPATNEVMKDFRNKLTELKKSIKSEAQCEPIKSNVENLSKLVTEGRDTFLKLTTKGQSQGLSPDDMKSVESYVSNLTTTTTALFDVITGNDACFAEDKQGNSLAFITGLIGEGSKILALVGGPVGGTISVAANVITGFLNGMDQVKKNRRGYKFEVIDQRIAYANTMCSFFEYRREVDTLLNPYESISNLQALETIIDRQLDLLYKSCKECAAMIDEVNAQVKSGNDTPALLWTDLFEKNLITKAEAIDKNYTRNLGTHTYRSLKTRTWLPERMTALQNTSLKADLGVQDVLNQMDNIENFLIDSQARWFLIQLKKDAGQWKNQLTSQVSAGHQLLDNIKQPLIPAQGMDLFPPAYYLYYGYNNAFDAYGDPEAFYKYAGAVVDSLEKANPNLSVTDKAKVRSYFKKLDDITRNLKISVDVADNYCTFFALADWYTPDISRECETQDYLYMKKDVAMFSSFSSSLANKLVSPIPAEIPPVDAPAIADLPTSEQQKQGRTEEELASGRPVQATTADATIADIAPDWVQSLTSSLEVLTNDPNYVDRTAFNPDLVPAQ